MEDLLKLQASLAGEIQKEYEAFKKENQERRSANAENRLSLLRQYYADFDTNNLTLEQFEDKTSDYFVKNQYQRVKAYFNEALTKILPYVKQQDENEEERHEKPPKHTLNKLEEKLRKQTANYKAFHRTVQNIDVEAITEKWEFEDTLRTLETRWSMIDSLYWEIVSELNGYEDKDLEDLFNKHEAEYNNLKKSLNSRMWSGSHREKTTPKLDVPTFSGNYNQWVSFKDLFSEAIHNNPSLSKAQKMQFLKSKVRGEAERLIQHLQISSDNYMVCWEILNHRYDNKKLIFTSHINILLELPIMKQQSLSNIKRMHDVTQESLNAIKNLGLDISTWDPLLVHILDQKLDAETHSEYIDSLKDRRELPVLKDFLDFLEGKFTALESSRRKSDNIQQKTYNNQQWSQQPNPSTSYGKFYNKHENQSNNYYYSNKGNKYTGKSTFNVTTIKCPLCNLEHGLYNCKKFIELQPEQKLKCVKELRVCINCLFSHNGNECKSTKMCRKCAKKHNTFMHESFAKSGATSGVTTTNNNEHVPQNLQQNSSDEVLLSTAMIRVKGMDGTFYNMRALVDQGSQISLITERAAQHLKLKRKSCKGSIFGVGVNENSGKGIINIECFSIHNDFTFQTEAVIMNNLVGNLPSKTFKKPDWTFIENISLADPEFYISRPVDILLGADIYSNILLGGVLKGENTTQPIVQQTQLGWLLCGSARTYQCNVVLHNYDEMKRFWEVEEISEQPNLSMEDQNCITFYSTTTNRKEDGRYEVRLPLKENIEEKLGSSKETALAQFRSLERKFQKLPKLENDYKTFMSEYRALNHMTLVDSDATPEYYLPHHGVERVDSLTTQYRVVYNGSHKTTSGYSLNDLMYAGPNLQIDLQLLLLRWRQYQYVYTADIEKMFRMILVNEQDQKYQRIYWRDSLEQPIQIYSLTTVTYGTRAAPFLAMMTLKKLAADERANFPEAAKIVESAFYMDDLLHGSDTIEKGKKMISDLDSLMKSGGFNLRKWSSNETKLLEDIKQERNKTEDKVFNFKTDNVSKTLGLCWDSSKDKFTFQYNIPKQTSTITKRSLLSDVSKLFDPLGWLAPVTTKLKLLFQKVWKDDLKWDDPVTPEIQREWLKIKEELYIINQYDVSRWIMSRKNDVIELHGYCDASVEAYACVIYARVKGTTNMVILTAKTKLVPSKKAITLPRLELSGAHLLSKLMKKVKEALSQHELEIFGWTDSMVVLGWLQGEPNRWKPFVANRVQKTIDVMPSTCWRYVKSNENPADAASRGLYPSQLKKHELWWQGAPLPLTFDQERTTTYTTNQDLKTKHVNVIKKQENHIIDDLLQKHSSFIKIMRIVAWLMRAFKPNICEQRPNYLTLQEINVAKLLIIKHVQHCDFRTEIDTLRKNNKLNTKSQLLNLNPFIDNFGVLRVGGRLENANINMEKKHPKIIPRDSRLAELLISEAHLLTFHGGPRVSLANLRQQYWIPGGVNAMKKQLRTCVTCRKNNPTKQHQLMGDLPAARTEPAYPFYHTGVDYTGFVDIKANPTRNARTLKGYIALFICMVTKAIHLELVWDLSSAAFMGALRRMSARRGAPGHLYSDCGTNFVGANRALQEEYEQIKQTFDDNFLSVLANMKITWHFNAPSWPSAGGLWERAVRSLKFHLKRVVGAQRLTFEEYSTLLSQLEACLNSRPLCSLTENIDDLDYLTPAHFLTGRAGLTVIETPEDARTRWHLTNQIFNQIWKKWKQEYLTELTTRNKWQQSQTNIQKGDLVTIQDENLPAGKWPMARVVELHPGRDGLVRVVTLKTERGYIQRPIVKLCILPIRQTKENKSDDQSQQQTFKKTNKNCRAKISSVVTALLFFTTLLSTSAYGLSNMTGLNNNQTIYFDPLAKMQFLRDQWTLIAYYDMSPYVEGTTACQKLLNYLDQTCTDMEQNNRGKCNMILAQLIHEFTEIQYYNQLLLTQHFEEQSRQRRGLVNGIGYIANDLFGVLDERFAQKYIEDINLIKQNQAHIKNLWANQTSIIESQQNYLKRTEEIMEKQHKHINKHLNSIDKAINTLQNEVKKVNQGQDLTLSLLTAVSMIQNLKGLQNMMLDTISDIYQGQFNIHLLTPNQLQEQLNLISGLLNKDITLPIENIHTDLKNIYKLLKIKARMTEEYFIFEIIIPLISRETYDLYHVIPIPKPFRGDALVITPIAEYVAMNLQKDSYLPISHENLQGCISRDISTYLCQINIPIYKMKSDKDLCIQDMEKNICKTSIAACENKWTGLAKPNNYLYFCCTSCQLRAICGDQVTAHQLRLASVISLDNDCIIKTNEFTIYGRKQYESRMNVMYNVETSVVAPINEVINITIENEMENYTDINPEHKKWFKEIEGKIKMLKDATYPDINEVSYHDAHHYTMIYCLVVLLIVVMVVAWRRTRGSWNNPSTSSDDAERSSRPPPPPQPTARRAARPRPCPDLHLTISDSETEMKDLTKGRSKPIVFPKLVISDVSV